MSNLLDGVPIVGGLLKTELHHQLQRHRPEIEKWAMGKAFEAMGLPNLTGGEKLSREDFTKAINAGPLAGTGLQLTNIFDKRAIQLDFQRLALGMTMQALGMPARSAGLDDLRDGLREWVSGQVRAQLADGAADDLVKDAKDLIEVVNIIAAVNKEFREARKAGLPPPTGAPPKKPLKTDKVSVQNRERQARYRAGHKKRWVAK